jgi:hypothetical protein
MEAAYFTENLAYACKSKRRNNPDQNWHIHRRENIKSYIGGCVSTNSHVSALTMEAFVRMFLVEFDFGPYRSTLLPTLHQPGLEHSTAAKSGLSYEIIRNNILGIIYDFCI